MVMTLFSWSGNKLIIHTCIIQNKWYPNKRISPWMDHCQGFIGCKTTQWWIRVVGTCGGTSDSRQTSSCICTISFSCCRNDLGFVLHDTEIEHVHFMLLCCWESNSKSKCIICIVMLLRICWQNDVQAVSWVFSMIVTFDPESCNDSLQLDIRFYLLQRLSR